MNDNRLIVFELSGEYGHFRKFNTTTSPLTYPIPTRTALTGLLGAVMGVERETGPGRFAADGVPVQEVFDRHQCDLTVQLLAPVKKVNMGFNLLDTGNSFFEIRKSGRTQIEFELLKNPVFRVFIRLRDNVLFDRLAERLMARSHHFTPYLGLSQFTAILQNTCIASGTVRAADSGYIPIESAINLSLLTEDQSIDFNQTAHYYVETMPIELNRDRVVTRYGEVLVEANGASVPVKTSEWFETVGFGNILFL